MSNPKLTNKQQAFIKEYLIDLNAAAAARRAGYSPGIAKRIGYDNLKKPAVAAALKEAMGARAEKLELKAEDVVQEIRTLAFSNMLDYLRINGDTVEVNFSNLTREQAAALTEVTVDTLADGTTRVKLKLADKRASLDLLMRHLGQYNDRVNVNLTKDPASMTDEELEAALRAAGQI